MSDLVLITLIICGTVVFVASLIFMGNILPSGFLSEWMRRKQDRLDEMVKHKAVCERFADKGARK